MDVTELEQKRQLKLTLIRRTDVYKQNFNGLFFKT